MELPKETSKWQKKINRHLNTIAKLQLSIDNRNIYRANANAFIRKLLKENRVTTDELKQYFRPMKEYKPLPEIE